MLIKSVPPIVEFASVFLLQIGVYMRLKRSGLMPPNCCQGDTNLRMHLVS